MTLELTDLTNGGILPNFDCPVLLCNCVCSFEAENGIAAQERGQPKNAGSQEPIEEAQGSFQYTAPDGTPIQLQYIANEGGFQPTG